MTREEFGRLTRAWHGVETVLPAGWRLDSIRCASSGLDPEKRSSDWVVMACGPGEACAEENGRDPEQALAALFRRFASAPMARRADRLPRRRTRDPRAIEARARFLIDAERAGARYAAATTDDEREAIERDWVQRWLEPGRGQTATG